MPQLSQWKHFIRLQIACDFSPISSWLQNYIGITAHDLIATTAAIKTFPIGKIALPDFVIICAKGISFQV